MIKGEVVVRPRYGEVDQMGYVYHGNYVDYCHFARTELLRSLGICDKVLEDHGIMMPVIEMNLKYKKPVGYDEEIRVLTCLKKFPDTRMNFEFSFVNENDDLVCKAQSTVVFVDRISRKPQRVPSIIKEALADQFKEISVVA
ncbi:acyl-CoA thioesterase [Marinifilum caeruleilacunae]|uniref:Acyl-CoA thioesterase n=1 Tax=Marinifilum caeruleilacunae TaxID=2499076 RepID=A0ABX1WRI5_9BACT|nr:thioesterase family protein [Marinifilum caeruleilacunae]NOU58538.1 acyl-CoA thioesterase [Marinifilum caeruleilacunae]